jgi:hypothetical protein
VVGSAANCIKSNKYRHSQPPCCSFKFRWSDVVSVLLHVLDAPNNNMQWSCCCRLEGAPRTKQDWRLSAQ